MFYYLGTYNNGYCGCDEECLLKGNEDEIKMYEILEEAMDLYYGFAYPDERFIDIYRDDYESEEEYDEALKQAEEEYRDNCLELTILEKITKEEYEEYKNNGYPILYEGKEEE